MRVYAVRLPSICTNCIRVSCSPVLSGLCGLYNYGNLCNITALCTSAAPERAVLQFSVDSVYSITATLASTVYLSCTWKGCSPVLCGLCVLYYCNLSKLCTSAAPERTVLQFSVDSVYSIIATLASCVPQLHLNGLFSSSLCTLCTLYCKGYHSTVYLSCMHLNGLFSSSLCTLCTLYCKGYHSTVYLSCMHLNGLFSSSLWTLCTLLLQPLRALCTSCSCTWKAVLQFSVDSVYSTCILQRLSQHCVPT